MKKQAYTMIAMIVLVGSMAVAAQAQTSGRTQLIANIPFQFNVGNKTLPAGEYPVDRQRRVCQRRELKIQSRDGKASAMVRMMTVNRQDAGKRKADLQSLRQPLLLCQAWVDNDNTGFEAPKSRAERAAEREIAGITAKTEAVALRNR